jgi:hypothetical protein
MGSVIGKFKDFKGYQLTKLWYDEEKSNNQIDGYMAGGHGASNNVSKENVIVLYSDFTVDSSGGDGSLEPNSTSPIGTGFLSETTAKENGEWMTGVIDYKAW